MFTRRALIAAIPALTLAGRLRASRADTETQVPQDPLPLQDGLPSQAEEFVSSIANDVLAVAKADISEEAKKQQFRALLEAHADIPTLAVFSLGRYASQLADDMREHYFSLVSGYIARIFVIHSANLGGRSVDVLGSSQRSERETIVESKVWFESGRALPVIWRVIVTTSGYKVFDVSVNGIWLAIQQRSEFVSVIRDNNGDINALLAFLTRNN